MTNQAITFPSFDRAEMLNCLRPYQRDVIEPLLDTHSEEDVAKLWLASEGPSGSAKFGGIGSDNQPFWDRVKAEFRMLVCGDEKYSSLRNKINETGKPSAQAIIGLASLSIASQLGVATALIAPAITILLYVAVKVGINAWCSV
ncbi:MAG: hypothetical protein EOO88_34680 [Pedobacter sp.]|jgi:hypothetical protein|nr:MAG: hypothetical protein EOO88_34680 [Pedobacter sp.]